MQGGHAAGFDLALHACVEVAAELFRGPDDGVAAVVFFEHHGHGLVAEEHHVDVVGLPVGGHVLGIDADLLARDEGLELVFDVVQVRPGHHFVGDQKQLAAGPVVELVFDGALVNDPAVAPVDGHDGLEEHVFARALRPMDDQGAFHLGARVLDGIGQPAQHPLEQFFGPAVARAHVAQQVKQVVAHARLGRGGPARPQVAVDVGVCAGGVEAYFGDAHDALVGVLCPGAVQVPREARIAHVTHGHQAVLLMVEHGAALAIHQGIALQQLVEGFDRAQWRVHRVNPAPLRLLCTRRALRHAPAQCQEAGLHLGAHDVQAFQQVQVVEVRELGALGVEGGAAGFFVGKHRGHVGAAHFHGRSAGACDAGVAFAESVVVGADQDLGGLVALVHGAGHRGQVARIKRHHHRQARGLVQRGRRGVALGHQDDGRTGQHAQNVEVALLDQPGGPELFFQAAGLLAWHAATDDLQAMDVAGHVQHGDHHRALGREPHPVPVHTLAVQVFAVALLGATLPGLGGALGRPGGVCLAGQLAAALVFGQALAQALALLCADFGLAQLHLGGVVLGTAPHAVAANNQVIAIRKADFMQVIPAALFAVPLYLAAAQAANVQAIHHQASALQLAQNIIVIRGHQ